MVAIASTCRSPGLERIVESPEVLQSGDFGSTYASCINGAVIDTCIMHADGGIGGGDWCEAFAIGDELVALSIGDVCGHGVEKMAIMELLRERLHDALVRGQRPRDALEDVNRFLRDYDVGENATAIVGVLDVGRRTLTFVNAGHPPPLIAGLYGATYLEFSRPDVPLGVCAAIYPTTHVVGIAASTLLVFYTDGVSEHQRDPLTGSAELFAATIAAHARPGIPSAAFLRAQMSLTGINQDDAALLTLRMPLAPLFRSDRRNTRRATIPSRVFASSMVR